MDLQNCPICKAEVKPNPRYPRYVCRACYAKASSADGRQIEFFNTHMSGGYTANFVDSQEHYASHECFIDGIRCYADEARFGGIVIQPVETE